MKSGVYISGRESGRIWGQEIIYIMHCMKFSMLNEMYCTKFSKNKHEHCFFLNEMIGTNHAESI